MAQRDRDLGEAVRAEFQGRLRKLQDQRLEAPFEKLASAQDSEKVLACLGGLAPPFREVLMLRFQEEMSLDEIAEVTGAPLSTVKSRLYRGLEALKPRLVQKGATA